MKERLKREIVRRRLLGSCCAVLSLLAIGAGAWLFHMPVSAALWTHPYFVIRDLCIEGEGPLLSEADIQAWISLQRGTSLWDAAPVPLRARLEEHPVIESATVTREFPGRLEIIVRERQPYAIVVLDRLYYVDRDGRLLRPLSPADSRNYPLISGLDSDMTPGYRVWAVRRALELIEASRQRASIADVSEVKIDSKRGVVLHPVDPKVPILLGWDDWEAKLARVSKVLRLGTTQLDAIAALDVRFRNQVVLRRANPGPASARSQRGLAV